MVDEIQAPAEPVLDLAQLYTALAVAHGAFPAIPRSRTVTVRMKAGGTYTFSYAQLEEIMAHIRKPLAENGLALMQRVIEISGKQFVETMLTHKSGESIGNRVPLLVLDIGPQGYKSALTYAQRAGVTLLLVLAAEEDDDGNQAEGNELVKDENVALGRDQARQAGIPRVDPDLMKEYVKRIQSLIDNQDPAGALVLYEELNQLERDYIWSLEGMRARTKDDKNTYRGVLRNAGRVKDGQP